METKTRVLRLPDERTRKTEPVILELQDGSWLRIDILSETVFRIRQRPNGTWTESGLNRYGFLRESFDSVKHAVLKDGHQVLVKTAAATVTVDVSDGRVAFALAEALESLTTVAGGAMTGSGFRLRFALGQKEEIYGLGDCNRDSLSRRGRSYDIWVKNVLGYIPVPLALSTGGWGVFVNTTWRNHVDVGETVPDIMEWSAASADVDYYLFSGATLRDLLCQYMSLAGCPSMLPIWGYSLAYVCHQDVDAFQMMNEAYEMRKLGIPCGIIGLEPGWMSKIYDYSTEKNWDDKKFNIPFWTPKGGESSFLGALDRLGYKLSLWQCCDYDLSVFEESSLAGGHAPTCFREEVGVGGGAKTGEQRSVAAEAFEQDKHLDGFKEETETTEEAPEAPAQELEPWFEHWKKFVDQGARAFKLDGSNQVNEHPDRKWGNGMDDEQLHNLYPMMLDRQMGHGFETYAKLRSMVYSASGYAGVQQCVATWAGDTGGGPRPLASMLNMGLSGHSHHSCDMDPFCHEGIHFGFLQSWSQLNNWAYWRQPWYLAPEDLAIFKDYACLRQRLLPYIYSSAHQGRKSGLPLMRAMPLAYPGDIDRTYELTQYMLGDNLLVTAYTNNMQLPPGRWLDCWTWERTEGPLEQATVYPENRGGCLYLREGGIVPLWEVQQHVEKGWSENLELVIFPGRESSSFDLYEDDGETLDYRTEGRVAKTTIQCQPLDETEGWVIYIKPREGDFEGMNDRRNLKFRIYLQKQPHVDGTGNDGNMTNLWHDNEKWLEITMKNMNPNRETRVTLTY